jgi:hypothetical protein
VKEGDDVSYDLIVWPVDRALTVEEAIAEVEHFGGAFQFGLGHDRRLDAFVEAMRERYPGLHGNEEHRPFEFDLMRKHVFIAVPDSAAVEVAAVVADAAWTAGVAVFDPQREVVALPRPFGDAPMSLDGIDAHVADLDAQALDRMTDEGGPG